MGSEMCIRDSIKMIRLGVLGSTNGTALQAILESVKAKKINAIVNVVISNKKNAYILKRGQNHGLPSIFILSLIHI